MVVIITFTWDSKPIPIDLAHNRFGPFTGNTHIHMFKLRFYISYLLNKIYYGTYGTYGSFVPNRFGDILLAFMRRPNPLEHVELVHNRFESLM